MRRFGVTLALFGVALAGLASVGCGGDTASRQHGAATQHGVGGATATQQGGGATTGMSDTGDGGAGADACPDVMQLGQPISEFPSQVGCYVGIGGRWQAVPCECDLWVDSPRTSELNASFALSFTPANMAPSLDGDVEVDVAFPDAGATWFDVWRRQAEQGSTFAVTHSSEDGTTLVRLGQSEVTLDPVPLVACESRHARATIKASWGTALNVAMVATLADRSGNALTSITGHCTQFATHPTPAHDSEGGVAGSP